MFNIQQRGQGPWTTSSFTADRWYLAATDDTDSAAIITLADADRTAIGDESATYAWQDVVTGSTTAANFSVFVQNTEDVRRLSNKTITVSFYAKASAALNVGVSLSQIFGTGGSPSATVAPAAQTIAISTTWARYVATFVLGSTSGKTLGTNGDSKTQACFALSSGTTGATGYGVGAQSGTFQFWGMQMEVGSVASPLEKTLIGIETTKCQRFYQFVEAQQWGYVVTSTIVGQSLINAVPMRAVPTVAVSNTNYTNCGTFTTSVSSYYVTYYATMTATGSFYIQANCALSADL